MRRLRILRSLTARQWSLLVQAGLLVPVTALALRLRGLAFTSRLLGRALPLRPSRTADDAAIHDVVLAVDRVGRLLPLRSPCLVRSVSAQALLRRTGVTAELRLGVYRDRSDFEAHAWLEWGGAVLNDDLDHLAGVEPFGADEPAIPW